MAEKNQKTSSKKDRNEIPLHFNISLDMPSVYATNVLIQASEHEVIISFFEAQQPFFLEENEAENIETLKKVGIRAECVARVTVAKARFKGFAQAMSSLAEQLK